MSTGGTREVAEATERTMKGHRSHSLTGYNAIYIIFYSSLCFLGRSFNYASHRTPGRLMPINFSIANGHLSVSSQGTRGTRPTSAGPGRSRLGSLMDSRSGYRYADHKVGNLKQALSQLRGLWGQRRGGSSGPTQAVRVTSRCPWDLAGKQPQPSPLLKRSTQHRHPTRPTGRTGEAGRARP